MKTEIFIRQGKSFMKNKKFDGCFCKNELPYKVTNFITVHNGDLFHIYNKLAVCIEYLGEIFSETI